MDHAHSTPNGAAPDERYDLHAPLPAGADVVVVGGGVAGCSVAYQLAKRGKRVVLLEMRGICSGASGRNAGMVGQGSGMYSRIGQAVYRLTSENLRMLRDELPAELGDDFELRLPGSLDIATTEEQWEYLAETTAAQREQDLSVRLLDRYELRQLVPVVAEHVLGAKLAEKSGHHWPFRIVHTLAGGARKYGARIYPWTAAKAILSQNGRVTGVQTTRGTVATDTVVVAVNAWAPTLLADLPEGAVVPARGQILVTQPVAPILPHPFGTNFDKEYGRQTATGELIMGGFRRLDDDEGLGHYNERVSLPSILGCAGCLASLFPVVGQVRIVRCWAGIMGFTADGLPLIGPYDAADGLYVAAGFNGGGFSWAAATGRALAELIVDGSSSFDLGPFDSNRFARGVVAWENPFTAGEKNNPLNPASATTDRAHAVGAEA